MYLVAVLDIDDLDPSVKKQAELLLSKPESERYNRFHHASDAELFLFGRYLTRSLIASTTGRKPNSLHITSNGPAEKPYVQGLSHQFSISHSGKFVAVAASTRPVGIDIQMHDNEDVAALENFFTEKEKDYVGTSPTRFYKLWTAIESLAKITGLGFNEALRRRETKVGNAVESFTFDEKTFEVTVIKDTDELTLSIVTTEPVTLSQVPRSTASDPYLSSLQHNLTLYSASSNAEPAV